MCERRSGGVKSTLKQAPRAAAPFRGPRSHVHSMNTENTFQTSGPYSRAMTPTSHTRTPQLSDGTTERWEQYATGGGVQADDARFHARMKDEEAQYIVQVRASTPQTGPSSLGDKLIQVSPEKPSVMSKNTDLLIDLEVPPQGAHGARRSYADATASTANRGVHTNLLD